MKKCFLLYILIIIIIFSFFLSINKKNMADTRKTVVFWTLQLGTFNKYITDIISDFEKENPDIKIKWVDIPYSEGEKRTLAAILTDNPPDLVNLTPDFSLRLAQKNALFNIDANYLSDYIPSVINSLKFNDKYFGIPFYATSAVTLYNNDLISKMQITKLPVCYDDLFDYAENHQPMTHYFLTMINFTENDTFLKILNKYNINSPYNINSTKSQTLYKKFKYLYDNNFLPRESITQTHRDALEKFMSGQLVLIVTGANFLNMIKENAPSIYKNTKILPQLTGSSGKYDFSLMNLIIPKKAHNKEEALKFAIFLTNTNNQIEFAKLTTILPVNKYAIQDEYFTNDSGDLISKARIISAKQLSNIQPALINIKNKKELNTLSSNYIQEILINDKDINKILDRFANDWNKL